MIRWCKTVRSNSSPKADPRPNRHLRLDVECSHPEYVLAFLDIPCSTVFKVISLTKVSAKFPAQPHEKKKTRIKDPTLAQTFQPLEKGDIYGFFFAQNHPPK